MSNVKRTGKRHDNQQLSQLEQMFPKHASADLEAALRLCHNDVDQAAEHILGQDEWQRSERGGRKAKEATSQPAFHTTRKDGEPRSTSSKDYSGGSSTRTTGVHGKSGKLETSSTSARTPKTSQATVDEEQTKNVERRQTTKIPLTTQPSGKPTTQVPAEKTNEGHKTQEAKKALAATPLPASSPWGKGRDWGNHFAPPAPPHLSSFPPILAHSEEDKMATHETPASQHLEAIATPQTSTIPESAPKREYKVVEPIGPKPVVPAAPLMGSGVPSYAAALAGEKKSGFQQKVEAAPSLAPVEQHQAEEHPAPASAAESAPPEEPAATLAQEPATEAAQIETTVEAAKPAKEKKSKKKSSKVAASSSSEISNVEATIPTPTSPSPAIHTTPEPAASEPSADSTITVTLEPSEPQPSSITVDIQSSTVQETQAPASEPTLAQAPITESNAPKAISTDASNSEAPTAVNTKRNASDRAEKAVKSTSKVTRKPKTAPKTSNVASFGSFVPHKPTKFQFGSLGLPEDNVSEEIAESHQEENQVEDQVVAVEKEEYSEAPSDVTTTEQVVSTETLPVQPVPSVPQQPTAIPITAQPIEPVASQQPTHTPESISQTPLTHATVQQPSSQPNPQSNGILPLNPVASAPRGPTHYQQPAQAQQGTGPAGQRSGPMGSHQSQKSGAYYHTPQGSMGYGAQGSFTQDFSGMQNTGFPGSDFNTPAAPLGNYGGAFYDDPSRGFSDSAYMGNHFDGNSNSGPGNRRGPRNTGNNVRGGYDRNSGAHQNSSSNPNVNVNMGNTSVGGNAQQSPQANPAVNGSASPAPANPQMGLNAANPGMVDPNVVHGMARGGFGHMFPPQMFIPFMGHPFYGFGSPFPMPSGSNHYVPSMMPGFPMGSEDESHQHPVHSHPAPHGHNMPYPPNGPHMMPHMYNQQLGMPLSHPHGVAHEPQYNLYAHQGTGMGAAQNPQHAKVHSNHAGNPHPGHNHGEQNYRSKGHMGGNEYSVNGASVAPGFYQGGQGNPGNMPPHNRQQNQIPKWT